VARRAEKLGTAWAHQESSGSRRQPSWRSVDRLSLAGSGGAA